MSDVIADAKAIFLEALDLAGPHERLQFLDKACGTNVALRERVEELLQANQDAGGFLDGVVPARDEPGGERPGAVHGQYKLLEQIGEGGFGVVYMAEQQAPIRRKVAFKVLKPGMDTRQVIARFEAERQALALMDHPNIARVFDGGQTEAGRPYFVMELVRGTPITQYCDEHHLTIPQRLELFMNVCHAVQHAHQKGIIHRDLKPNNVLIASHDGKPVVKVIDFGIAKAITGPLTDKTLFTGFAQMIGTPLYMSPEQAGQSSLDVDTRSDIYSLGVLLYELITGATPFDSEILKKASFDEMRRIIREEEPPAPSTRFSTKSAVASTASTKRRSDPRRLSQIIRGELDWIIMKALDKDRDRRYETASSFATDVQRYLADEPVAAGPPSMVYRTRKFLRRNRGAVATATLVVLALLGGIVGTTWGMVEAREAEDRLGKEAEEKTKALDKALEDFNRAEKAERDMRLALNEREEALGIYGIALAAREWDAGRPTLADRALDGCPAEKRLWEWHHLKRLCNSEIRRVRFLDSGNWIGAVSALSPDGNHFAAPLNTAPLSPWHIWDTRTGRNIAVLNTLRAGTIAIRSDNQAIAHAGAFGIRVFDLNGIELVQMSKPIGYFSSVPISGSGVAYSPDDKRILACHMMAAANNPEKILSQSVPPTIFDAGTGQALVKFDPGPHTVCGRVAFNDDGRMVAIECRDFGPERNNAQSNRIQVADSQTGKTIHMLAGHADIIRSLAFSPKGKYLASCGLDRTIKIWDVESGKEFRTLVGHDETVNVVRFSPDGQILASGSADKTVRLWDVQSGRAILIQRGHDNEIHALVFRADGAQVSSAGADATFRTWKVGPSPNHLDLPGKWDRIHFSPSGDRLVATRLTQETKLKKTAEIRIWNTSTFKEVLVRQFPSVQQPDIRFHEGRLLAILQTKGHEVVDVETGKSVQILANVLGLQSRSPDWQRSVNHSGIGPGQGKSSRQAMNVHDAETGNRLYHLGIFESGAGSFFHPDGKRLILAPAKDAPRILDVKDGRQLGVLKANGAEFGAVAFSADGHFLAAGMNIKNRLGDLRVWDLRTGEPVVAMDGHPDGILSLAFHPDGRRLVSASKDKTLKIWELRTGRELFTLRGHASAVKQVSFNPVGTFIASVDADGTLKFWDGRPWQETPGRIVNPIRGDDRGKEPDVANEAKRFGKGIPTPIH